VVRQRQAALERSVFFEQYASDLIAAHGELALSESQVKAVAEAASPTRQACRHGNPRPPLRFCGTETTRLIDFAAGPSIPILDLAVLARLRRQLNRSRELRDVRLGTVTDQQVLVRLRVQTNVVPTSTGTVSRYQTQPAAHRHRP